MSVGDLIGRAFRFWRLHIPLIMQVLLWPTVISIAGKIGIQWGITLFARKDFSIWPAAALAIGAGFIITIVTAFLLILRNIALIRLCNGFADDFKEAYEYVRTRSGTLIGLVVLGTILISGVMLLWIGELVIAAVLFRPGTALVFVMAFAMWIGLVGVILSAIMYWAIGAVVMSAMACEEKGIGALIGRGFSLTFNDFGRSLFFAILLIVTVYSLHYPLSLPAICVTVFELFRHGVSSANSNPMHMPLYVLVFTEAWESIVNMFIWPVTWLAFGQFYYDLRIRQEGLDVLQTLNQIEKVGAA